MRASGGIEEYSISFQISKDMKPQYTIPNKTNKDFKMASEITQEDVKQFKDEILEKKSSLWAYELSVEFLTRVPTARTWQSLQIKGQPRRRRFSAGKEGLE